MISALMKWAIGGVAMVCISFWVAEGKRIVRHW
jgi:hypothetical protein